MQDGLFNVMSGSMTIFQTEPFFLVEAVWEIFSSICKCCSYLRSQANHAYKKSYPEIGTFVCISYFRNIWISIWRYIDKGIMNNCKFIVVCLDFQGWIFRLELKVRCSFRFPYPQKVHYHRANEGRHFVGKGKLWHMVNKLLLNMTYATIAHFSPPF